MLASSLQGGIESDDVISLVSFLLVGVCEAIGVLLAYRIFADLVRSEAVFTPNQIKRLKGIALVFVALFIIELVCPTGDMLLAEANAGYLGLENEASTVSSMPRLNLSSLLFAAVFYCASAIFEYASLLQQASDETIGPSAPRAHSGLEGSSAQRKAPSCIVGKGPSAFPGSLHALARRPSAWAKGRAALGHDASPCSLATTRQSPTPKAKASGSHPYRPRTRWREEVRRGSCCSQRSAAIRPWRST